MITSATHWGFIGAAYGVAGLVVAGLIAWVIIDGRRHTRALRDLEARGVRRRSAGTTSP